MQRRLLIVLILLLVGIVALLWWSGEPPASPAPVPGESSASSSVDFTGWCCQAPGSACDASDSGAQCLSDNGIVFVKDAVECNRICTSIAQ